MPAAVSRSRSSSPYAVEQMAVGLPMVVTAVGGNAEAVVDGENGYVIAPHDAAALGRAVAALHGDPARAAAMARASRLRSEQKFSLQRMCAAHAELYLALCGRPGTGLAP